MKKRNKKLNWYVINNPKQAKLEKEITRNLALLMLAVMVVAVMNFSESTFKKQKQIVPAYAFVVAVILLLIVESVTLTECKQKIHTVKVYLTAIISRSQNRE